MKVGDKVKLIENIFTQDKWCDLLKEISLPGAIIEYLIRGGDAILVAYLGGHWVAIKIINDGNSYNIPNHYLKCVKPKRKYAGHHLTKIFK